MLRDEVRGEQKTVMIDATYLTAHRTAACQMPNRCLEIVAMTLTGSGKHWKAKVYAPVFRVESGALTAVVIYRV